jgi:hypothetical protein
MTTFFIRHQGCPRRVHKKANADGFQIHVTNCTIKLRCHIHEAGKIQCIKLQGAVRVHVTEWSFYRVQALPLVRTRFLRLANSSSKPARSPARRSRSGRAASGKTAGEMTHVLSAQFPGSSRAAATAMPPHGRADGSQDNLPCAGVGRAMAAPETCETILNMAAPQSEQRSRQYPAR